MDNIANKCRTLFLIDETRDYTNDFYILELTKIILFEEGAYTLNIAQICEKIEKLTDMQYTEKEILHAIQIMGTDSIECINNEFSLTSIGQKMMQKREKNTSLKPYIKEFIAHSTKHYGIIEQDAVELLYKFIYERFNENIAQIASILDCNVDVNFESEYYSEDENAFVNDFLAWNDTEKNRLVFRLIAKSFDYCMINTKCGKSSLDFSKFYFYIDTNIILRLMGFNNEDRKSSIEAFIDKCLNNNIHIVVSNYVLEECRYSIDRQIDILEQKTCKLNSLISPQGMSFAEENAIFCGVYQDYYDWCRTNKHKNYVGFRKYMKEKVKKTISKFETNIDNQSFEITNKIVFNKYYYALEDLKNDKHIIKTDINSVMLVEQLRENNIELNYHLISADGVLIKWAKECYNAEKGLVEYPSTWLSVLLKYTGREKTNDFKSFCQFIHLPIRPETEDDLEKKIELKAQIMSSNFDDEIKSNMLEDIKSNYYEYKDLKIDSIIHYSYAKTTDEISKTAIQTFGEQVRTEQEETYNQKLEEIDEGYKKREIKKEEEYKSELEKTREREFNKGTDYGREETISILAKNKAKTNRRIRAFITFLFVFSLIISVVFVGSFFIKNDTISNVLLNWIKEFPTVIKILVPVFSVIVAALKGVLKWGLKGIDILPIDEEKIKQNYLKKM